MTASYLLDETKGHVTALDGDSVSSENIVIIAGTSTGLIVQLTMTSLESPMEVFSSFEMGTSIRRIHIHDDDTIYVLDSHKVYLFSRSNCSESTSCAETMAARNPLCGWCVYLQRATRKFECSDEAYHWISSLHTCKPVVTLTPSNIPVSDSRRNNVNVNLTFVHLPVPRADDNFKCRLIDDNSDVIEGDIKADRNGKMFSCDMPLIKGHIELKLDLFVQTSSSESVLLSEMPILFFECRKFTRCTECIKRSDQHCNWCNDAVRCQSRESICKTGLIDTEENCPQLSDMRGEHYVHAGNTSLIRFPGINLPMNSDNIITKYIYTCNMFSLTSNATVDNNFISCRVNVPKLSDRSLLDEPTKIYYGINETRTSLTDKYENYVTIYNCTMLASDCSHCEALNKTRFSCSWCSINGRCTYRDDGCFATECPPPTIFDITPRDGPVTGNTRVTINGLNLGSDISEIVNIKVADIPCKMSDEISQMNVTDYGNFVSRAPQRIICRTGSSHGETSGTVSVIVNGQVSYSDVIFSFRVSAVTDIVPDYGPKAGGTRVTLSGQNIGIGNRNILVQLEGRTCLRPEVAPKLSLENITPTNFTIICTIDKGYTSNISTVTLSIDNDIVVSEAPVLFTFVANPIIDPITPKKAFLSGGTKITIKGTYIDNAHEAKITLHHGQYLEMSNCSIVSDILATCNVPRAPESLKEELSKLDNANGQFSKNVRVLCVIRLDNIQENIEIAYYRDPIIDDLTGSNRVVQFKANDRLLQITGRRLNDVATIFDVTVTVGVKLCSLVELTSYYITCIAPKYKPNSAIPNSLFTEVNVTIGNLHKMVGYVDYEEGSTTRISSPLVILSVVLPCLVLILIITLATVWVCRQYRRMKSRLRTLQNENIIKEENTNVIRFSRLAGNSDETEYSYLYNDLIGPLAPDLYNTLSADDIDSAIQTSNDARSYLNEHLPETNTLIRRQSEDTLLSRKKITVEIELEGERATNVAIVSSDSDDQSYLHAII